MLPINTSSFFEIKSHQKKASDDERVVKKRVRKQIKKIPKISENNSISQAIFFMILKITKQKKELMIVILKRKRK